MHDTVGIIYQFPSSETADLEDVASPTSLLNYPGAGTADMEATASTSLLDHLRSEQEPSRKRRRFDGISRDV